MSVLLPSSSSPATDGIPRRQFLKLFGAAGLLFPNLIIPRGIAALTGAAATSKITVGAIGIGGIGTPDLGMFLYDSRVQVVAVCDVNPSKAAKAKAQVDQVYSSTDCKIYADYRELLLRDDIDAIMCAVPDHWHAQISIDAMRAGKDVFCEKPLGLTIDEGKKMLATARQFGRVLCSGSQRVIGDHGFAACAARSGRFGKILVGKASPGGSAKPCFLPAEPMPPGLMDWDMWLGPAPYAPFHRGRCAGMEGFNGMGFRSWSDYTGGGMTDWGAHYFGALMHGMGLDQTGPTEILPADRAKKIPLTFVFANGMKIECNVDGLRGLEYHCEAGLVYPSLNEAIPPGLRWYENGAKHPITDFIGCIATRKRPFQDVEYAHRTASLCHLGNISYLLNRPLKWDPEKEEFVNDAEASRFLSRPRRGPWQI